MAERVMPARSSAQPAAVIGCDFGSQGLKVVLVSLDGELLGEAGAAYNVDYPRPAWAEQPAQAWLDALPQAIGQLRADTGFAPKQVRALGLAAQVDGVVAAGADGQPLRPAIIWMDRRAVAQCAAAAQAAGSAELIQRSGLNLDATHVAPKIRWLAENEPEIYDAARYFLLPGSYVAYRLTGELGVDDANASSTLLMDVTQRAWSPELCQLFAIPLERLAPLRPATDVLGGLRPSLAEALGLTAGIPVTVGTGDEHAACAGAGVVRPGLVCDIAGTAEPVCASSAQPVFDPTGLVETHCHADPALWLLENPGFVSGANYRWFRDQFAPLEVQTAAQSAAQGGPSAYDLLNDLAAQVPPGAEGLVLLPCLMGAMTPTWNAAARGTFAGFTLAHRREHFARAVLEASAYAVRDIVDQMRQMGLPLAEMRAVGGGARSRLWRQIKADVTGLPVTLPQTSETTALGAALLALVAIGAFANLSEAANRVVCIVETVEPEPATQARYDDCYQFYRETYFAMLPVYERAARRGDGR
jgi:xylulokinase